MASAKMASALDVRIDDVGSILKFRIGFPFEHSGGFCQSVWLPKSILNFRIRPVSSIGGLLAATLFADTISDSQIKEVWGLWTENRGAPFCSAEKLKDPIIVKYRLCRVNSVRSLNSLRR